MISEKDFKGQKFSQNCGDILEIIEKTEKRSGNNYLWKCKFLKYPYEILIADRRRIIEGKIINPRIEIEEFINKTWLQKCGDILKILEKGTKPGYFWCEFQKYPIKLLCSKNSILEGSVVNPEIENYEFIGKKYFQKASDDFLIVKKKTNKKQGNITLFECEFQKYPCIVYSAKKEILNGSVLNPRIEEEEFVNKIWFQNCGDSIKVLKKTNQKRGSSYLWECEFQKYPYKILKIKSDIIKGVVLNPRIEEEEFIKKEWLQNCGQILKILEKTNKISFGATLFKCQFIGYNKIYLKTKKEIQLGTVENQELPWKTKELLCDFIDNNFQNIKPTLSEIAKSLKVSVTTIGNAINDFSLRDKINYFEWEQEKELFSFLIKNNVRVKKEYWGEDKDFHYELDNYLPELKIGFEFNGNYWHSDLFKKNNYHQLKKNYFKQEKNIDVFFIWEWEWNNELYKDKIKSYIKSKCGIFDKIIYARQCIIRELNNQEYQKFCQINHLQNDAGAIIKLGLFYKGELVQIISFSKPRFAESFEWEIIRECSKLGYVIIGGKERLWKYFIKKWNPRNCISYCDFSKFNGNSYLKLGFKKERLNKPGFNWWEENTQEVYWRNPFGYKKLKENPKIHKLYDCGQLVFIWNK